MLTSRDKHDFIFENFSGQILVDLNMIECMFLDVKFVKSKFIACKFIKCEFINVKFDKSIMSAEFIECKFINCSKNDTHDTNLVMHNCKTITTSKRTPATLDIINVPNKLRCVHDESMEIATEQATPSNVIKCESCDTNFDTEHEYNQHKNLFNSYNLNCGDFKDGCVKCGIKYANVLKYVGHKCINACDECGSIYKHASRIYWRKQAFVQYGFKCSVLLDGCPYCDEVVPSKDVSSHMWTCKGYKLYKIVCKHYTTKFNRDTTYDEYKVMYKHKISQFTTDKGFALMRCTECGIVYATYSEIIQHIYETFESGIKCYD